MDEEKKAPRKKPWIPEESSWKCRLVVGGLMFLLAFSGVLVTVWKREGAWNYWRFLAAVFAAMSLGLSAYLKHYQWKEALVTVWHEIFHWLGLFLSIALLSNMVKLGILSPFSASLQALVLLALATFLAGIYIEKTFLFIGILMGCFALVLSYISLYSYLLLVPLSLGFIIAFYWFVRSKSHQMTEEKNK